MRHLFVFRALPDADHMVPVAWKLLESGDEVHALLSPGYDAKADYRMRFLASHPRGFVYAAPEGRLERWWRTSVLYALLFLVRHRIDLVAVEWGVGPSARPRQALKDVLATLVYSAPGYTRLSVVYAARLLRRPTVSLPHGLNIKLTADASPEVAERLKLGPLDWRDRNRFAAYVLNTEHHRAWHLEHARGDAAVLQTWGAARWAPEWVDVNRRIAPQFAWPAGTEDAARARRVKVVFMVPKWQKRVDANAVVELVARLQRLDAIVLAIKGHPRREDGAADPLRSDPRVDWSRLIDASGVESVPLIAASDVVIDVGSSIGLEVVLQGKTLINPAYLHEVRTLFDAVPGSCLLAGDAEEVVAALVAHATGHPWRIAEESRGEVLRRGVYGEREPFDVLDLYHQRLAAIGASRSQPEVET